MIAMILFTSIKLKRLSLPTVFSLLFYLIISGKGMDFL